MRIWELKKLNKCLEMERSFCRSTEWTKNVYPYRKLEMIVDSGGVLLLLALTHCWLSTISFVYKFFIIILKIICVPAAHVMSSMEKELG